MKKLLFFLSISTAAILTACGDGADKQATTTADTTATAPTAPAPAADSSTVAAAPALKDSVMQFKGGKVMIIVGGAWSELSAPVTTTNGRKVSLSGEVSKGGKTKKLEEGMMIDKDGQLMDKDGKPLDTTGWD